jgi:hypothetical protein
MSKLYSIVNSLTDQMRRAFSEAPTFCYGVVVLIAIELATIFIAPAILPSHLYLKLFLPENSKTSIAKLVRGADDYFVYDPVVGWRNRPNANIRKWVTDSLGSRSAHPVLEQSAKPVRVLFLGNSVINGGDRIDANETISFYAEDSNTESINFATMLYSLDQAYLSYVSELYRYHPNILVVGLQGDPGRGLGNRFVPFAKREEINIPFFKPRFILRDTGICLVPAYALGAYDAILNSDSALDSLIATDDYSSNFLKWEHFGLTPVSDCIWKAIQTVKSKLEVLSGRSTPLDLTRALMRQLVKIAHDNHAEVVFMVLPDRREAFVSQLRANFPDGYELVVDQLKGEEFTIFDCRPVVRSSGVSGELLYMPDGVHFTPEGNRIIAAGLKPFLKAEIPQHMGMHN